MTKLLTKTKKIVIFILLLTIFPLTFVEGFMAYLHHFSDDEELKLLNQTLAHYKQIKTARFENKGHFVYSTIGVAFPEFWQSIIG